MRTLNIALLLIIMIFSGASCSKSSDSGSGTGGGTATVPEVYKKIYGATSITSDGTYITIKTSGAPDHKSVYYPAGNSLYDHSVEQHLEGILFRRTLIT